MAFDKAKALQEAGKSVIQGKISQAIRQYFDIFEKDSSDVILLNTIGDLYVRDRNIPEGLKQFNRLAEAYVQEGFTVKAIAIYKKIVKLVPNSADSMVRLAELYQIQRLAREAREQYFLVAEFFKKQGQTDNALEAMRKAVHLDIENASARDRLAKFCEEIGRKEEAREVYLGTAQIASRRGDAAAAQGAFQRAQQLDPQSKQIYLHKAREALATQHPAEVEAILSAIPALKDDPDSQALLLESYLSTQQPMKAEKLVLDRFHANHGDFPPVASFVSMCVRLHDFNTAFKILSELADGLIEQKNTRPLMASLREIWNNSSEHLPTLELIYRICVGTGDEAELPEVLEALGNAYMKGEQFENAEQAYQQLVSREPDNEEYKVLLQDVLQKQGKEVLQEQGEEVLRKQGEEVRTQDADRSASEEPPEETAAPPLAAASKDTKRETLVKEGLENSDLFVRYHLMEKAVAELDKVLEIYPDEIEIHKRLVDICRKEMPERAKQEALALVRICTQQGDTAGAERYAQMAEGQYTAAAQTIPSQEVPAPEAGQEVLPSLPAEPEAAAPGGIGVASESSPASTQEVEPAPTPPVSAPASAELTFDLAPLPEQEPLTAGEPLIEILDISPGDLPAMTDAETPLDLSAVPPPETLPGAPVESPLDLWSTTASSPPPVPLAETREIDLFEDWEFTQTQAAPASPPLPISQEAPSFNYEDSRIEVEFYLQNDFLDEARRAVEQLENKLPNDPRIAELRAMIEGRKGARPGEAPEETPAELIQPTSSGPIAPPPQEPASAETLESTLPGPVVPPLEEPASATAVEPMLPGPIAPPPQEPASAETLESTLPGPVVPPLEEPASAKAVEPSLLGPVAPPPQEPASAETLESILPGPVVPPLEEPASAKAVEPTLLGPVAPPAQEPVSAEALESALPGLFAPPLEEQASAKAVEPMLPGPVASPPQEPVSAEALESALPGLFVPPLEEPASAKAVEPMLPGPVAPPSLEPPSATAIKPTLPDAIVPPSEEPVKEWEWVVSRAVPEPETQPAALPPSSPGGEGIPAESPVHAATEGTAVPQDDLAKAFESSLLGRAEPVPAPAAPSAPTEEPTPISTEAKPEPPLLLGGLLQEMGEGPGVGPAEQDDPQTHYNLAVAFREMNLLDEAIGEFQKAVKGAVKGNYPPNYLAACSLLALCFMNKGMAPVAVKWYRRALETPGLDAEGALALQYDLGVAYEQAGDLRSALENFIEVYGENIDFRDVADKVRQLQQKVT